MYKRQLSEWLEVKVFQNGNIYEQRYERGKVMYPLKIVGSCDMEKTGTEVHFLPDKEIFEDTVYDYNVLKQRLREMAFLTKNLRITLKDDREDKKEKVFYIKDYSSNGTFKNQSENCLPQNMEISLEVGTILDIGDEGNRFILE